MMKCSESIANLAAGLAKFNGEVSRISKDAANPFFKNKYATLDTIIDEVRPILTKHGLSIMQFPSGDGENITLKTILIHESGEWIESENLTIKPVKNDPQAVGSAVTYARRYSLAAFLSLNTGEDDDGYRATYGDKKESPREPKQKVINEKPLDNFITQKQVGQIKVLSEQLVGLGVAKKDSVNLVKLQIGEFKELTDLNFDRAERAIKALEELKVQHTPQGA